MRALAVFAVVCAPLLNAAAPVNPLTICLDDRVGLSLRSKQAFDTELSKLSRAPLYRHEAPCSSRRAIRIAVRSHAPARYGTALGLAHAAGDRVLPVIELYAAGVIRTVGGRVGAEDFGRALARVAFHELEHYTRQEHKHDGTGLFAASLDCSQLLTAILD